MSHVPFEIERKFLVASDRYRELAVSHALIRQGYLCANGALPSLTTPLSSPEGRPGGVTPEGRPGGVLPTVRVRQYGEQYFLTIKGRPAEGHFGRLEWEREISREDFETLFPLAISGVVEKTRWLVPLEGGLVCEVDEFHGLNEGLVLAEVEMPSEDTQIPYPDFLLFPAADAAAAPSVRDVTSDGRYYNSYLSTHPYCTWVQ